MQNSTSVFKFFLIQSLCLYPWTLAPSVLYMLGIKDVAGVIPQRFLLIEHWLILRRIIA